jgi:WD40 repeat protein
LKSNISRISLRWFLWLIFSLPVISAGLVSAQQNDHKFVHQIAKSGDGRVIGVLYTIDAQAYPEIDLFDSSTGQLIRTVDISPAIAFIISLSPTGDRIAHTSSDGEVGIFDIATEIDTILRGGGAISVDALEWSPVNDQVAYARGSGIYIIDARTGTTIHSIGGGSPMVVQVAWSRNGQHMATSHYGEDPFTTGVVYRGIKVWDLSTPDEFLNVPTLKLEDQGGGSLTWSPEGNQLALLANNELVIYDIRTNHVVADLSFDEKSPVTVVWNMTGSLVAIGGKEIRIWDTATWEIIRTIPSEVFTSTLQWSFDSEHLFNDNGAHGLYLDNVPVSQLSLIPTSPVR